MPQLMCPNCNSNMQALNRSSVEFDMCPTCRGVWLDRGELEKILEGARAEAAPIQEPKRERDDRREHRERDHGDGRRKRGFDMFEIFD